MSKQLISIVVPCYNEEANIASFYKHLSTTLSKAASQRFELIYVNDGSRDNTLAELHKLAKKDRSVKIVNLSRNFGKEIATTAGIHRASGDAIIMIDADGQHPAELIPEFVKKWQAGAQVVIGVRTSNQKEGLVKRYGSKLFYQLFNTMTDAKLIPKSTDYRLIDKSVQSEFIRMTERNRITRGLIDWLGFKQDLVYFQANEREFGEASYSVSKLMKLALDSFVSMSLKPLYFSAYAGAIIMPLTVILFLFSVIEMVAGDPMNLNITGSAYLVMFVLFLTGLLLISQGIMAIYLSHIHTETQNRPLFIVDEANSTPNEQVLKEL